MWKAPMSDEHNPMLPKIVRGTCAAAVLMIAQQAIAGLYPMYPPGTTPGSMWEVDRYPPAVWSNAGTINGRNNVLDLGLSSDDGPTPSLNRPSGSVYSSSFYNTQGRGFAVNLPSYAVLYGSIYIPAAWATTNAGDTVLNRRSELWGTLSPATGADTCDQSACNLFPIIGFTNANPANQLAGGGTGRLRVFDSYIGFIDLATPVPYGQWTDVCTVWNGTEVHYYVNGADVYSFAGGVPDPLYGPPTHFSRQIQEAYNFGSTYTSQWSTLGGGQLTAGTATGGGVQATAINSTFPAALTAQVVDGSGTPLPCVPVTFTAPASGASASLSTITVVSNAQGMASVNATANGNFGSYMVVASLPAGVAPVSFSLTNLGPPSAIVATGGSGQTASINAVFGAALMARVTDAGGNPLPGIAVTFTLPASGASGTFPGGVSSVTVFTDANGVAVSPLVTANGIAGNYSATASVAGGITVNYSLANIAPAPPTPPAQIPTLGMPALGLLALLAAWLAARSAGTRRRRNVSGV
jgi:hypothetical protein